MTPDSVNDFNTKKAVYIDADGYFVSDEANKAKLDNPQKLAFDKVKKKIEKT